MRAQPRKLLLSSLNTNAHIKISGFGCAKQDTESSADASSRFTIAHYYIMIYISRSIDPSLHVPINGLICVHAGHPRTLSVSQGTPQQTSGTWACSRTPCSVATRL